MKAQIDLNIFRISLLVLAFSFAAQEVEAYWIWTREAKRWVNPKYSLKATSKEQYDWASDFYKQKEYSRAINEFRRLLKHYPDSPEAEDAQYMMGRVYEEAGSYYEAYLAYQKLIDKYPQTRRTMELIEREYAIGNLFYTGEKRKVGGVDLLPAKDLAMEIYRKLVENSPFGQYGDLAQYKVGLCLRDFGKLKEAKEAFEKVLDDYPKSRLYPDALYQVGYCSYKMSLGASYDQVATERSLREFEDFLRQYPDSDSAGEARAMIAELKEKKAAHAFEIASFYDKQGNVNSARIYYKEIVEDYPDSPWAAKSRERLTEIEGQLK